MKSWSWILLLPLGTLRAADLPQGAPLSPGKNVAVEWKVPTNELPAKVTIYQVTPQSFSPAVISNVVALGGWTMPQRVQPSWRPRPCDAGSP
ncbi:MAG TPA: hypothetical protein VGF13_17385 [Verrucomicrobiae bacterium]|jgi:hypothetical protein